MFKVFLIVLLLPSAAISAESNQLDAENSLFNYVFCSDFFAVLSKNLSDEKSKEQFALMSEHMMDYAISLPGEGDTRLEKGDIARNLQAKMLKSEEDARRIIELYAPQCKELLLRTSDGENAP